MAAHRHLADARPAVPTPPTPTPPSTPTPTPTPPSTPSRPTRRRHTMSASVGLGVVGLLAGLLFSTSASLASGSSERRPENLRDLVAIEQERLEETNAEVADLRTELAELYADEADPSDVDPRTAFAAGSTAVTGPGLVVQLWDAPVPARLSDGVTPDDLVVHQQDLEAVMNALWAGGAEAMTVQGHRVTATTSVRCVGNVLLIDGSTYSPPYEVAAIGATSALQDALGASDQVQIYLQYVEALGLGWSVSEESTLEMAADESNLTLEHAVVPG